MPNHHDLHTPETVVDRPTLDTERTTAATDALLAVVAGFGAAAVAATQADPWRAGLWSWALALLAGAAAAGAIIHGLRPSRFWSSVLWGTVFAAIGLDIPVILLAALYDLLGREPIIWIAAIGGPLFLVFYAVALRRRPRFSEIVPFEAASATAALVIYIVLAARGGLPGAVWIAAGLGASIVAGGVQALYRGRVRLLWTFDHNGLFHLIQIAGVVLMVLGLIRA